MLFKKKTEVEVELTEEDIKTLRRLEMLRMRYESFKSDHNLEKVDDVRYKEEEEIISNELDELEHASAFDEMMGHPLDYLDEIFHKAVNDCESNISD